MSPTPFDDLRDFVAIPRTSGLRLSPDGSRLVTAVSELSVDRKRWVTALWAIDPTGTAEPRRLTRSASGEANPEFLPDGSLLFTSRRADPDDSESGNAGAARRGGAEESGLWLLPDAGGEARHLVTPPGGITATAVASDAGTVVFSSPVTPGASDLDDDGRRRKARADADITALLHESYPIRHWDHDLGPGQLRLFTLDPAGAGAGNAAPRDLTPEPGRALDEQEFDVTPDGGTVVTSWKVFPGGAEASRPELVAIDTETGERRVVASDEDHEFSAPVIAPDGRRVVCLRERRCTRTEPPDITLWLVGLDGTGGRDLTADLDLWPVSPEWSHDGRYVYFVADTGGRRPAYRVDIETGEVTRLTGDDGAYSSPCAAPDGKHLYALRGSVDEPATPVRMDSAAPRQTSVRLPAPGVPVDLPGALTEVATTADDGQPLRAWLALPAGAGKGYPAPLLMWAHGGPLASFNDWHWRWNPWVAVARGYAVLLPDPALSTGYGLDFIRRGWGAWGGSPYTDLMAITDATVKRDDIDETRTGMAGGSFGGYMANWIAGHTDRFRGIVTHASLWILDQMTATTDDASYWRREFGDIEDSAERYTANSPHHHVGNIRTPMLVIHGDKDYRVPVSEGVKLWWDLTRYEVEAKFLYFPDENHWVLRPAEAQLWYETVLAFCDHHVLGEPWQRPELL